MTILLSQLFSPATLLASALFTPRLELSPSAKLVPARAPESSAGLRALTLGTTNRLLDTVFGLPPMQEERPYAL
jgi:hypothetical protein